MGTKPQIRKKAITLIQVGWVALFLAIAGGVYGFYNGGPEGMVLVFAECFVGGFILAYVCASFIELLRK